MPIAAIRGIHRAFAGCPQLQEWQLPMPNGLRSVNSCCGLSAPVASPKCERPQNPPTRATIARLMVRMCFTAFLVFLKTMRLQQLTDRFAVVEDVHRPAAVVRERQRGVDAHRPVDGTEDLRHAIGSVSRDL